MRFTSTLIAIALLAIAGAAPALAQNLNVAPDDTLLITDPNPDPLDLPTVHATLTNSSPVASKVYVVRHIETLPAGQSSYFCFGAGCYAPSQDVSFDTVFVVQGDRNQTFKAYLDPQGVAGESIIRYDFIDAAAGTTTSVRFHVLAQVTAVKGLAALRSLIGGSLPATGTLRLAATPGIGITLSDALGRTVRTATLAATPTDLSISGLAPGAYYLSTTDGRRVRVAIQ